MIETAPPQWPEWRMATYRSFLTMIGDTVCAVSLCADGNRWYAWHYRKLGNGEYSADTHLESATGDGTRAMFLNSRDAKAAIHRYVTGKDGES